MNRPTRPHSIDSVRRLSTQGCFENTLKFICEFKPGDEDQDISLGCEPISVTLPAQCSVYQLRLRICMEVCKLALSGLSCKGCFPFILIDCVGCSSGSIK